MDGTCAPLELDREKQLLDQGSLGAEFSAGSLSELRAELLEGLTGQQKVINPKFFYDQRGSMLFDHITALPEYYLTRTEIGILRDNATAIADCAGRGAVLIEPGAGSCAKIRYLLDQLEPITYLPQDISAEFLQQTTADLHDEYPWLDVQPLVGDFAGGIELPRELPDSRRIVFYPGSTIGNFDPPQALKFMCDIRRLLGAEGGVIIGVDLQKDPAVLNAAYNDAAGITAEFNRNILHHINRLLDTHIAAELFSHHAFYNDEKHRIEMHLVSEQAQNVCYQKADFECTLGFTKGESIHTESSYKYTPQSFSHLAKQAGFTVREKWLDKDEWFGVFCLE